MSKDKTTTETANRKVYMTKDYSRFKTMDGNREVNKSHVLQLQKLMLANGNLTGEFPIVVDGDGYIIDGQHRVLALTELGWEIGYVIEESATIDTVRSINQGNRNWSWRDLAHSYAERGNENYAWFIAFVDQYGLRFNPALFIVQGKQRRSSSASGFNTGELVIKDKARAHDVARQLTDIQRMVQIVNSDFSSALIVIMQSPAYNHERMLTKLRTIGKELPAKARLSDYMRQLEEAFNHGYAPENKARLF